MTYSHSTGQGNPDNFGPFPYISSFMSFVHKIYHHQVHFDNLGATWNTFVLVLLQLRLKDIFGEFFVTQGFLSVGSVDTTSTLRHFGANFVGHQATSAVVLV